GAKTQIEEAIKAQGTNLITITPGSFSAGAVRGGAGTNTRLSENDANALREMPQLAYVVESSSTQQQLNTGGVNWRTSVEGTNVDLPAIRSWNLMYGSFFTPEDVKAAAKVIVLGANVAETLYGENVDPTDMILRVAKH